eukprot:TRINITY_DN6765_c0_g2_i1.p1 TRINITY_DN6765_c0_g2~~TRINITY_DN6765_c0_g2_i1.p1  ORF type:complete len:543 (-),score=92.62 TRINITY_DN6765_c0_g2_i1:107-1735(-)
MQASVTWSNGENEHCTVHHHLNSFIIRSSTKEKKWKYADLVSVPVLGFDEEEAKLSLISGETCSLRFSEPHDMTKFENSCAKAKGVRQVGGRTVASTGGKSISFPASAQTATVGKRRSSFGGSMHDFEKMGSCNSLPRSVTTPDEKSFKKRRAVDDHCGDISGNTPEKSRPTTPAPVMRRAPPRDSSLLTLTQRLTPPQQSLVYRSYRSNETFGLRNLGNTCYLNAVLQAVCSLREFVAGLRSMTKLLPTCSNGDLFSRTTEILTQMNSTDHSRGPPNPAKLLEAVAKACPMFAGGGQQDAHEFLLEYINQLHDELLGARNSWLRTQTSDNSGDEDIVLATQLYFDSEVQKRLECGKCSETRVLPEQFRDFSLDFCPEADSNSALGKMLSSYFVPELLEAKCEKCGSAEARLTKTLASMPRVLVLHLKRFVPNLEKQRYDKQHQTISCPLQLDLRFCLGMDSDRAEEATGSCYSLRAVVAHDGASPHSGHYVCYARGQNGGWRLFNDSIARDLPESFDPRVDQQLQSQAYILFYALEDSGIA